MTPFQGLTSIHESCSSLYFNSVHHSISFNINLDSTHSVPIVIQMEACGSPVAVWRTGRPTELPSARTGNVQPCAALMLQDFSKTRIFIDFQRGLIWVFKSCDFFPQLKSGLKAVGILMLYPGFVNIKQQKQPTAVAEVARNL